MPCGGVMNKIGRVGNEEAGQALTDVCILRLILIFMASNLLPPIAIRRL